MTGTRTIVRTALLAAIAAGASLNIRPPHPEAAAMSVELLREPRVVILKSARELVLYDGDRLVKKYPIALAANAPGPKEREGDRGRPRDRTMSARGMPPAASTSSWG